MEALPTPTTLDMVVLDENVDRVKVLKDQRSFLALSYHLQEGKKRGSIYYGKVENKKILIKFEHKFENCGLLALDIVKEDGGIVDFVVSCSDGTFRALTLKDKGVSIVLEETAIYQIDNSVCLNHFMRDDKVIGVALANGKIGILDMSSGDIKNFKAHDYEVWSVRFSTSQRDVLLSGSDDSLLKLWDVRGDLSKPFQVNKQHGAGVCCIVEAPDDTNILFTGSFDQRIMEWDLRNMKQPIHELNLGKSVWDINFKTPKTLGVCCVYDGYSILNIDRSQLKIEEEFEFKDHKSLCYGLDFLGDEEDLVLSCSFYDNELRIWKYKNLSKLSN